MLSRENIAPYKPLAPSSADLSALVGSSLQRHRAGQRSQIPNSGTPWYSSKKTDLISIPRSISRIWTYKYEAVVAERVETLQRYGRNRSTPEAPPHDLWRKVVGDFFEGEEDSADGCTEGDLAIIKADARSQAKWHTETPAAQAADRISLLLAEIFREQRKEKVARSVLNKFTFVAFEFEEKTGDDVADAAADVDEWAFFT